jgi:hypothetical protein
VVEGKEDELCFYDIGRTLKVWLLHGSQIFDTDLPGVFDIASSPIISVLMPPSGNDVSDGTVESISLTYDMGQVDSILADLIAKYGQQPDCEKSTKRTGIGVPVDSLECTWKTPWGIVWFDAPSTKIDTLSVHAATTKYWEEVLEQQRKESDKRKAEF